MVYSGDGGCASVPADGLVMHSVCIKGTQLVTNVCKTGPLPYGSGSFVFLAKFGPLFCSSCVKYARCFEGVVLLNLPHLSGYQKLEWGEIKKRS